MSISTDTIKQNIEQLSKEQLQQVGDFIAFLKFQDKRRHLNLEPTQLTILATEFADEDRDFAEEGMNDYTEMLQQEDRKL